MRTKQDPVVSISLGMKKRNLSQLPYEILSLILDFVAQDVAAAINLASTCKTFLLLGMNTPIPLDSSSPTQHMIEAPNTLQSCDLCNRYWLKGGVHDDEKNWSNEFRVLKDSAEDSLQNYFCIICPGGGETLRKLDQHHAQASIRNRLAEEMTMFQQALQAS